MKLLLTFLTVFFISAGLSAQVFFKTEYIGSSGYRNADNNKTGGKGDATIFSGGIQLPLSMKMNENNRPTVWSLGVGGSYTSFNNKNLSNELCPSEIMNAQITVMHMRPIKKNMSILAVLGVGSYSAHADFSRIRMSNILGHGGAIFVWHLRSNLDLGAGLALNTSFGYPMAFPAFYLNWGLSGRYEIKVNMMNALEVSAGMKMCDIFKLSIAAEMSGSAAFEKINGKNMMFSHQYMIAGLRPEFTFGKLSIPITIGVSAERSAYYEERTLKAFFKSMGREYDPHFTVAPAASVALRYSF